MIALQMAQVLAFLHERNVMHRDVKLENILLDRNFNVKLSDFGWCAHTTEERMTFCGTKEYITPEMVQGRHYGCSVDLYCLGIVLYELFYKKSPFNDSSEQKTFHNIEKKPLTFPSDSVRAIPPSAKELIASLLQKDPTRRPLAKSIFDHPFMLLHQDNESDEHTTARRITRDALEKFITEDLEKDDRKVEVEEPSRPEVSGNPPQEEPMEVVIDETVSAPTLSSEGKSD